MSARASVGCIGQSRTRRQWCNCRLSVANCPWPRSIVKWFLPGARGQVLGENYVRGGERWVYRAITDSAAVVQMSSIGCELPVAGVYRKVVFAPDPVQGGDPGTE